MTSCERGDLILVRFVFADEQGQKRRPALAVSSTAYHEGRQEVVVAAVTSHLQRLLPGDHQLEDWQTGGLPKPAVVTGILRTIKRTMIERILGRLTARDLLGVDQQLVRTLELGARRRAPRQQV